MFSGHFCALNFGEENIIICTVRTGSAQIGYVIQKGVGIDQSGRSVTKGGGEEWTNNQITRDFSESHFTQLKHKRRRKCTSVQKSEDYKTLISMMLGEITFVIGPDCIFVNL